MGTRLNEIFYAPVAYLHYLSICFEHPHETTSPVIRQPPQPFALFHSVTAVAPGQIGAVDAIIGDSRGFGIPAVADSQSRQRGQHRRRELDTVADAGE